MKNVPILIKNSLITLSALSFALGSGLSMASQKVKAVQSSSADNVVASVAVDSSLDKPIYNLHISSCDNLDDCTSKSFSDAGLKAIKPIKLSPYFISHFNKKPAQYTMLQFQSKNNSDYWYIATIKNDTYKNKLNIREENLHGRNVFVLSLDSDKTPITSFERVNKNVFSIKGQHTYNLQRNSTTLLESFTCFGSNATEKAVSADAYPINAQVNSKYGVFNQNGDYITDIVFLGKVNFYATNKSDVSEITAVIACNCEGG